MKRLGVLPTQIPSHGSPGSPGSPGFGLVLLQGAHFLSIQNQQDVSSEVFNRFPTRS
jgi:hypothetical protein